MSTPHREPDPPPSPGKHITVRLDETDQRTLDGCMGRVRLSRSDVLRLALRHYAASLGVLDEHVDPTARVA